MTHKKYSENVLNSSSLKYFARALSKEIILINSNKKLKAFNEKENSNYNINVYLYDTEKIDPKTNKKIKELIGEDCFCNYNDKECCYEIFLSIYSTELLNQLLNKDKIFFRGKTIDFSLSDLQLRKEILLSTYRHELAHIKISDMKNENKAFDYVKKNNIPFEIFNILEYIRVNSFWNRDYDNYRIIFNELYKVNKDLLKSDKTLEDIFFQVAITLNDKKNTYHSPDYPYMQDLFYRVQNASSAYEVALLSEELYKKIKTNQEKKLSHKEKFGSDFFNPDDPLEKDIETETNKNDNSDSSKNLDKDLDDNLSYDDFNFDFNDLFLEEGAGTKEKSNEDTKINPMKIFGSSDLLINSDEIQRELDKIKKESLLIRDDGSIVEKVKYVYREYNIDEQSFRYSKYYNFLCNDDEQTSLSILAIKKLELEIERKLQKDYFYDINITDDLLYELNEDNLFSLPINPLLEDIFIDKQKVFKETPKFIFFMDLSGSMSGTPLTTSKYILATLQNLANKNILDAKIVFHSTNSTGKDLHQIIDVKQINNYINKIGNLNTKNAEGIISAIKYAKNSISKDIKNSRAIFFLSDCNIEENSLQVKKAISELDNERIYAIYSNDDPLTQTISKYFDKGISVKNKQNPFDIAKEVILSIVDISNKELNHEDALKILKKNKNLIIYENKENEIKHLKKLTKNIKI